MTDHMSMSDIEALHRFQLAQAADLVKYKARAKEEHKQKLPAQRLALKNYLVGKKYVWAELRHDPVFMDLYRQVERARKRRRIP